MELHFRHRSIALMSAVLVTDSDMMHESSTSFLQHVITVGVRSFSCSIKPTISWVSVV
jgi:hypothetical protein